MVTAHHFLSSELLLFIPLIFHPHTQIHSYIYPHSQKQNITKKQTSNGFLANFHTLSCIHKHNVWQPRDDQTHRQILTTEVVILTLVLLKSVVSLVLCLVEQVHSLLYRWNWAAEINGDMKKIHQSTSSSKSVCDYIPTQSRKSQSVCDYIHT